MPKAIDIPAPLRAFVCHGAEVHQIPGSADEWVGECPLGCAKKKFYAKSDGRWSCMHGCGEGNTYDFLRLVHAVSMRATKDYSWVGSHRNFPADALRAWGVCKSFTTGEWIVPGYGAGGGIVNLYRYVLSGGKYRLYATPGLSAEAQGDESAGHGFFKPTNETFPDSAQSIDICEGPWDGIAWWLANGGTRTVVAVPGCGVWKASWNRLTANRVTTFLYDNDHPRTNPATGTVTQAAHAGLKRAVGMIASVSKDDSPREIKYLCWSGTNTKDDPGYNSVLPDGFDVRDLINDGSTVEQIDSMVRPVPGEWTEGKTVTRGANKGAALMPVECKNWKVMLSAWKKAARWTQELQGALGVMLASVASVRGQGEKVCIKLMSQPSTFKSQLCSAICVARRYTVADDGMNGFFSGYNDAGKGEEPVDRSLAGRLFDKTLVTKEGATLVDNPLKETIISQFRALYDGDATKDYKNGLRWEYQGLQFTWILSGTFGLRALDKTELGQRFLDYCIVREIDDEMEDEILDRVAERQLRASKVISSCKAETTVEEKYRIASQLTGGYINYLRQNIEELIQPVEVSEKNVNRIKRLAKFVEYMRARPSSSQDESVGRALASRVFGQMVKLCQYLCVVMQKREADKEVMWVIEKVARDTSDGRTLDIVTVLDPCGTLGLDLGGVCRRTRQDGTQLSREKEGRYLEFLTRIGALEQFEPEDTPSLAQRARWRLTDKFRKLYREVVSKADRKTA